MAGSLDEASSRSSSAVSLGQPAGRRGAFVAAGALLVGSFVALVVIRWREPLALDQGLFACFGRWVPRGWLPYRDLFDPKPPLQLYTFALGFALGGSTQSMWGFEAVYLALTMAVAGVLVGRRFGRWAGLVAAACLFFGLWSPGFGGYWARAQAEELAALPSLVGAFLALGALARPRLALATGLAVGLAGLYKIPAMGLAGAWATFWLLRLGMRQALPRLAYLAAGVALPWAAAFIWFGAQGAGEDFVGALFPFPSSMHHALGLGRGWLATLGSAAGTLLGEVPWLVVAGLVGCVRVARESRALATWLSCFVGFAFATVVAQRQLNGYHFLFVIPALAVAAAVGCRSVAYDLRTQVGGRRLVGGAALGLLLVLVVLRVPAWCRGYGPSARLLGNPGDRARLLEPFDVIGFSPRIEEEVASYLRAHTRPEDGVLVWGLSPGIYALADRHPVTRYAFHKILLTEAPLSRNVPGLAFRRKELIDTLRRDPPAYLVLGQNDANGFEPDESRISLMRFPQLAAIVRDEYRAEKNIGNFLLFRRVGR